MTVAQVAGQQFDLTAPAVERAVARVDPEPIREHYVVVKGRRYPPKQVLAYVTGLDRADFTTHQARSVLRRLGFGVYRRGEALLAPDPRHADWPHGGAEAALLSQYLGRWVAQDGLEILYDADDVWKVIRWLRKHGRSATVWQIPTSPSEMGSTSYTPL